ncbi:Hypothetical predicted protein [Olea europaea subsp. europaea]|uniref:Uncharacterized protein n=1 Tax=Olea europaea subsp. europaea TaxID=158383 RepID=A0A8S0UGG8_OLEEU|nr:Hypothetical predicted protein [Olea europaea subsp. europaea]
MKTFENKYWTEKKKEKNSSLNAYGTKRKSNFVRTVAKVTEWVSLFLQSVPDLKYKKAWEDVADVQEGHDFFYSKARRPLKDTQD